MGCDDDRNIDWENWRFQIDSTWSRSNYFAIVETVALAGAWQVLEQNKYPKTALFFAFLGLLSTIIWLLNDLINHAYIDFWWKRTPLSKDYEEKAKEGRWWPKFGLKYSHLMHVIPIIFGAAWLWMLGVFILPSPHRCCYILAAVGALMFTWFVLAIFKAIF